MKLKLRLPFNGKFPLTFPFGAVSDNEEIKKRFVQWGIKGHHGIDYGLPPGTEVLSCDRGAVIQSGHHLDWGISVTLKHRWGISIYAHLQQSQVHIGDKIKAGQVIGLSGQSGAAFGAHLHFGIKLNHPDPDNGYLGFSDPSPYFGMSK